MTERALPPDAFGDPFALEKLPLPRRAAGYAVQWLDSDRLLDRADGEFRPVRAAGRDALFASFDAAFAGAAAWVQAHRPEEHCLAIVPAGYDEVLERPILIYGVLCTAP